MFWIHCTDAEVEDYLSRWQYPGQCFSNPVQNRGQYNVFPEQFCGVRLPISYLFPGSGAIRVEVGNNKLTNVAWPSHIFYEGFVERSWFRDANGVPYVNSYGEGTNDGFSIIPGHAIDKANNIVGPYAFEVVDFGLIIYTTIVETGQFINEQGYYR